MASAGFTKFPPHNSTVRRLRPNQFGFNSLFCPVLMNRNLALVPYDLSKTEVYQEIFFIRF